MSDIINRSAGTLRRHAPKELLNILGAVLGLAFAAGMGALLSSALPAEHASAWLFAGCYAAPAAAAFAIYWFLAQKL